MSRPSGRHLLDHGRASAAGRKQLCAPFDNKKSKLTGRLVSILDAKSLIGRKTDLGPPRAPENTSCNENCEGILFSVDVWLRTNPCLKPICVVDEVKITPKLLTGTVF